MSMEGDDAGGADTVDAGLRELEMRADSGRSVLHLRAQLLPSGMFDGHPSAMVAPDHPLFHGITKRLVTGPFRLLAVPERKLVGVSLRKALARSHFPTTCSYNAKRNNMSAVGISECAATLPVFSVVLRRTLSHATRSTDTAMTSSTLPLKFLIASPTLSAQRTSSRA